MPSGSHCVVERVAGDDLQTAWIALADHLQRRQAALVPLDGDDAPSRPARSARVSPPGPGPTSTTVTPSSGPAGPGDAAREVEVEQKVLAEATSGPSDRAALIISRTGGRSSMAPSARRPNVREPEARDKARRVRATLSSEVESRAVVGRSADEGQAESDVDASSKASALPEQAPGRDTCRSPRHKLRRALPWNIVSAAAGPPPRCRRPELRHRRPMITPVLATEGAALARVRVQPRAMRAAALQPEALAHRSRHDRSAWKRSKLRVKMPGTRRAAHEWSPAQRPEARTKHHHGPSLDAPEALGKLGKVLRVTGMIEPRRVKD